ncbi:MAG: tRNA threonylcarbamoyladenosine biosynthesis protein TsaE [Paracidovorax wautersii]|uniref:tRNA threonylcarbamoyladenosine biosynthesis protein TsaE n=1 Tax=Paracidovorax wautersii TaxID=1177982 RepID=A0A7V8FPG9_9BURK|nr:MAG: tRNA threonylcarbamoyladenosine biosynthesis protein TsaE [Paracidovorax wautersii]
MVAGRQPRQQWLFRLTQVDISHADLGKSQLTTPSLYLRDQLNTIQNHAAIVETGADAALAAPASLTLAWRDEAATESFAQSLAGLMASQPELGNVYIALRGDLGAGKTTFVRHLLRALGVAGRIKSPTYAVVEPHQGTALAIWHFDFYRFNDPREWEDAGFRELFASTGLKIAEWPDKAAGHVPAADLALQIQAMTDDTRTVHITAHTASGQALLRALAKAGA